MSLSSITSWVSGVIDHVKGAKKWVGKAVGVGLEVAGVVANTSKDMAMETFKDWDEFKRKTKKIVEGAQVVVDGVVYVMMEVTDGLVDYIAKDKRAFGLGVSLISASICTTEVFRESRQVMEMTSEALFWLQASDFGYQTKVPCSNLRKSYHNVGHYIKTCSRRHDAIFMDTADLIGRTVGILDNFCGDVKMQRSLETCGCRCNCTKKNERMLTNIGLLDDHEVTEKRSSQAHPAVADVCSATRKIDECEGECKEDEQRIEHKIARELSGFCSRHASWDASQLAAPAAAGPVGADVAPAAVAVAQDIAPANVAAGADSVFEPAQEPPPASSSPAAGDASNTTAAAKETTTTGGTASLEAAFGYLSLIVSMII